MDSWNRADRVRPDLLCAWSSTNVRVIWWPQSQQQHAHIHRTIGFSADSGFLVIAGEVFGGIGLIVGLVGRIAALVIAITMLGAIGIVHFRFGLFLNWFGNKKGHGIEYHLLVIALALVVFVKGGGAFALDGLLSEHVFRVEQSVACDEQPNQNLELRTKINISGGFHE